MMERFDVVVVGGGNAGFAAALAAREEGASVLVLERAPREWAGGNSYFTAGAFRVPHDGLEDVLPLLADPDDPRLASTELPPYRERDFAADMDRMTYGRCDPELSALLIEQAAPTLRWLRGHGIGFELMYARQAYEVDGRHCFWGGLHLGVVGQGPGLIERYLELAREREITVRFGAGCVDLRTGLGGAIEGVVYETSEGRHDVAARGVVLAAGGFEADPRMRAGYLGANWDVAKVRGTPYNTGQVLRVALRHDAEPAGHWSGCHAVAWDAAAAGFGNRELTNRLTKQSYPLGIVVNADGQRFIDEGADFRNYTYAKYGAAILRQPGALAFQLFDAQTVSLLREAEYEAPGVSRVEAGSIRELAREIGMPERALATTVEEFNAAIADVPFDPSVLDGRGTRGLVTPKSNWALALEEPPFLAFGVTCGITFTFGGVRVDTSARVQHRDGGPLPGLYAAGELVGGLFYHNYPGGSGLTSGALFGRLAGMHAAERRHRTVAPVAATAADADNATNGGVRVHDRLEEAT